MYAQRSDINYTFQILIDEKRKIRKKWLSTFAQDIKKLRAKNKKVIIVSSGAIALGHPLGMTGTRLVLTATEELHLKTKNKFALCTMCVGVGQGSALILEKV